MLQNSLCLSEKKRWYYSPQGKKLFFTSKRGRLIVFEGIDGSGTTTQANLLFKYLKRKKKKVFLTSEPTHSLIGGLIKGQIAGEWQSSWECLQLLFAADRAHHLEKEIIPLLKKGITVICTRYILSALAYGLIDMAATNALFYLLPCSALKNSAKDIQWLLNVNEKFIWPDITFLLKVSPKVCIQRIKKERFHKELFEKEEKLEKVLKNYLKFSKKFKNIYIINGEKTIKEVFEDIRKFYELSTNNWS